MRGVLLHWCSCGSLGGGGGGRCIGGRGGLGCCGCRGSGGGGVGGGGGNCGCISGWRVGCLCAVVIVGGGVFDCFLLLFKSSACPF